MGSQRHIGIDLVPEAPWGTHFCLFYRTPQDLIDLLVPYFKAGLEHNEFCMWVTSDPLRAGDARAALARAVPDLPGYESRGQIEILDYTEWYTLSGHFDSDRVLAGWVDKEQDAVQRGFDGLRLTGNTFWLEETDWRAFIDYEAAVDSVISQYRMIALCTYSLDKCGASEVIDVTNHHQFALAKRGGEWQMIESADRRRAQEAQRYAAELEARVAERTRELQALNDDLQRSEQRYRSLFEGMNEGFALTEILCDEQDRPVDYRFLEINPAFERLTGLSRNDVLHQTARALMPELEDYWVESFGRVALTGEPVHFENYAAPLQQHYEVFAYSPARLQCAVLFLNVTERKRTEASLQEAMQRVKRLNRDLEQQAEELQVANVQLEEQAEELRVANANIEEALGHEHAARAEAETRQRTLEQREQSLQEALRSLQDAMREIERLNRDLERHSTELEIANRELEAFSYSVSHDLRTPLASVENFARLLSEEFAERLPQQGQLYLRLVRDSAHAMSRLIEGLLSFSRTSRQPLKKQRVQPTEMVRQVLAELCAAQGERPRELMIADLPECKADPVLLKQVWVNLLSNALKFTRTRDVARIEVGSRELDVRSRELHVGSRELDVGEQQPLSQTLSTAYYVRDNGVGLDVTQAEMLFGVFQRFHSEEEFEGTGVGLAIVDRIIRRHGGHVWAEGQVDQGATFYFTLA